MRIGENVYRKERSNQVVLKGSDKKELNDDSTILLNETVLCTI